MQHEIELAYVGIEVPDPASLTPFFGEVIGLVPGEPTDDGALTWRNDGKAHRVIVQPGPANDAVFLGFEAVDDDAFDAMAARLARTGHDVTEAVRRRPAGAAREASGPRLDSVGGPRRDRARRSPRRRPRSRRRCMPGGFLTDGVGFGHAVFATTAFDESHRVPHRRPRPRAVGLARDGDRARASSSRCASTTATRGTTRIALAKAPFDLPQTLHHIMFETNERDDVGAAFDRVWATDLADPERARPPRQRRHVQLLRASPAGFQVEVGHGARVITDGWDDNRRYDRISAWGHQPLRAA